VINDRVLSFLFFSFLFFSFFFLRKDGDHVQRRDDEYILSSSMAVSTVLHEQIVIVELDLWLILGLITNPGPGCDRHSPIGPFASQWIWMIVEKWELRCRIPDHFPSRKPLSSTDRDVLDSLGREK
jgi:hypothetical protein